MSKLTPRSQESDATPSVEMPEPREASSSPQLAAMEDGVITPRRPDVRESNRPAQTSASGGAGQSPASGAGANKSKLGLIGAAAVAVIGAGLYFGFHSSPKTSLESAEPNWKYVEKANEENDFKFKASKEANVTAERVDASGAVTSVAALGFAAADLDAQTTGAVKQALASNDPAGVQAALQSALKNIPPIPVTAKDPQGNPLVQPVPTLSPGMSAAVLSGDAQFVHVFLYDCCAEDGDIADVIVDGVPYCTVPLTHAGVTVAIPITQTAGTISIRGAFDGDGGGVTVGARTSQGDFFMRALNVGETEVLGSTMQQ